MDTYAQTGFQSACSEFSEQSLSLDERFDLANPSKILIPLNNDAPLFGMTRGNLLLMDRTQKPLNGDLILLENSDGGSIYRFEYNQGKPRLWPGNIILNEATHNLIGGVIILLIKEFILPVPLTTRQKSFLHNSDWKKI